MSADPSIGTQLKSPRRAYLALTITFLVIAVVEMAAQRTGYWQFGVFLVAPDLTLLLGAGRGLDPGQLHPRAVPAYNLAHRFAGPVVLAVLGFTGLLGIGFAIGALGWGAHIALDRALGYGLRTPDGYQRR